MANDDTAAIARLTPDELLTTRSVRRRLGLTRPVDIALVRECLRIALQAPNGSNVQWWRWIVVTAPDRRAALADLYRKAWQQRGDPRVHDSARHRQGALISTAHVRGAGFRPARRLPLDQVVRVDRW